MSDGEPQSKKPEDSDFQQQRLKAWQPLLTPKWVIGTFLVISAIFIPIGIVIVVYSNRVVELEVRYDNITPQFPPSTCPNGPNPAAIGYYRDYSSPEGLNATKMVTDCSTKIDITITEDMKAPVYFYYKLSNYYQNHRRYVKSRSDTQLADSGGSTSTCDPLETTDGKPNYPCGLIAGSFFVDRFSATVQRAGSVGGQVLGNWSVNSENWDKEGIAWSSDRNHKFKVNEEAYASPAFNHLGLLGVRLPPVDDEDFIVWMRTAGLPTFKKLYRKISTDLNKGDVVTVSVLNFYPVAEFSGEKAIVLSTTSFLGGKNSFLGWTYIVVGIVCIVLALAFAVKHAVSPRPLGDMKYFNWPGVKH